MLFSKKTLFFCFFMVMGYSTFLFTSVFAEFPKNNLMINTIGVIAGNYGPEFETTLGTHIGLGVRANLIPSWEAKGGNDGTVGDDYDWIYTVSGYGAGLSLRYYPFTKAPGGFHLGPRFDYIRFTGTYEDRVHNESPVDTSLTLVTGHLEVGYKFIFAQRVVLGLFADGGYVAAESEDHSDWLALAYIIGGGAYIGFAF